jgi:hypothetical protein
MARGTGGVVEWYVACCNAAEWERDGGAAGLTMTAMGVRVGFWVGTNWMTYWYIRKMG